MIERFCCDGMCEQGRDCPVRNQPRIQASVKPWVGLTEDMEKIKAYMASKMKHIKMYNECMNLADGLDVEKFAELVRADEREACAELCEEHFMSDGDWCAKRIRARSDK